MAMAEQKLALVLVICIYHFDNRVPEIRQVPKQLLLDFLELFRLDLVTLVPFVVAENKHLFHPAEFFGHELVDEHDVIVDSSHVEDLFNAEAGPGIPRASQGAVPALIPVLAEPALVPPFLDIPQQLHTELVGVDRVASRSGNGAGPVRIVDDLGGVQQFFRHQPGVPVGRPSLVHYFCLRLGDIIIGFISDDIQDSLLPLPQGSEVEKKAQNVHRGRGEDSGRDFDFGLFIHDVRLARVGRLFNERGHVGLLRGSFVIAGFRRLFMRAVLRPSTGFQVLRGAM